MSKTPHQVRERVSGPVYPVPPAFFADGGLDLESVRGYCRFLVDQGARALMVTAGSSRLNLLTPDEVHALNAAVAQSCGPEELCIAGAPPYGSTMTAVNAARAAADAGADACLLYYPERHYGDDDVFAFYATVAERGGLPLMIHGVPVPNGLGAGAVPYSLALMHRLAGLDQVVGMKEEFGDEGLRHRLAVEVGDRIPLIVAGGGLRKFVACAGFGVRSWLAAAGSFVPALETEFWRLWTGGHAEAALELVNERETPLFEAAVPIGWHAAMRAGLDILGLMPGFEREPMHVSTPKERAEMERALAELTRQP